MADATVVRWFLLVLAAIVVVPLAVPRRLFRAVLAASAALMAMFIAVSILRLGFLYAPTLALQARALRVLHKHEHPATSR